MRCLLAVMLLVLAALAAPAADTRFWYKLTVAHAAVDGSGAYDYYGSSPLAFQDLIAQLGTAAFVTLDDLRVWDEQDRPLSWNQYDPIHLNSVALRSAQVLVVQPLTGDPLTVQPGGRVHKESL